MISEEEDDRDSVHTAYGSNKEQCKIDLRIQSTAMCSLANKMRDFEEIDRMRPVALFLHDHATENQVGPK